MSMYRSIISAAVIGLPMASAFADALPDAATLEAEGYIIGEVALDKANIFDLSNPDENNWLYRAANRFHILTRDKVISRQLLFATGDAYDQRVVEESARILRRNGYIYDAHIKATQTADGVVDLTVRTRDVWSLTPELSLSRSGGETRSRIGIEEKNLFGYGQQLRILRDNDIDREENVIEFSDRNLGGSWVSLDARYSDNSDGDSSRLSAVRRFYSLDARWSAGATYYQDDRIDPIYQFGEAAAEYGHEREYFSAFGGWSKGLRNGKARRWLAGVVYDDNQFSEPTDPNVISLVPEDRKLAYPFVGLEIVEDGYVTTHNQDQMERTEDFQMGLNVRASLGWADTSFGSDRDAAIFSMSASRGFGSLEQTALLVAAGTSGRVESGDLANALLSFNVRLYHRQSKRRSFFASVSGTLGESLDLDNLVELGGDTGLRGYPIRYHVGESIALATIEQRYYTDWYPFRLFRVGGAIFADIGRAWGPHPLGDDHRDWSADVGFGLRLALTRITSKVVHIDFAFPLNDDPDIDDVQFLIEAKKSF
jgi:outer membrane protein assembly factor BamA